MKKSILILLFLISLIWLVSATVDDCPELISASLKGDLERVKYILENGVEAHERDRYKVIVLMYASMVGSQK